MARAAGGDHWLYSDCEELNRPGCHGSSAAASRLVGVLEMSQQRSGAVWVNWAGYRKLVETWQFHNSRAVQKAMLAYFCGGIMSSYRASGLFRRRCLIRHSRQTWYPNDTMADKAVA